MVYVIKKSRKPIKLDVHEVSAIVGLSVSRVMYLERHGQFPKRLSPVGRPRWSKLKIYQWLNRWGIRSERKRK